MKKKPKYPLEEVALIKYKRLEEAEKALKQKKEVLENENEKLEKFILKRDEVKKHRQEKIRKHMAELDKGTTSTKIQLHERYIKGVVDEELKVEEKRVGDQKKAVQKAEEDVEKARKDYLQKNLEVEKISMHRKEWAKERLVEADRHEGLETEEVGETGHARRKRKK